MKFIRAIVFWFNFVVFTCILYALLLLVVLFHELFAKDKRSEGAHWVATVWGRTLMALAPGWKARVHGLEHLPTPRKDPPVVMVANHQSGADIWALYLTGAQFRWLSKAEVFKLPLIGSAMRWAGYVPIHRGDRGSHGAALRASGEWIKRGISMVFFPEGTRSEDGNLKEFKPGAFRLAYEHKVAIQPIIIRGTRHMMHKKSLMPMPAQLEVEVLPPVFPGEAESIEAFTQRIHGLFQERLQEKMQTLEKASPDPLQGLTQNLELN